MTWLTRWTFHTAVSVLLLATAFTRPAQAETFPEDYYFDYQLGFGSRSHSGAFVAPSESGHSQLSGASTLAVHWTMPGRHWTLGVRVDVGFDAWRKGEVPTGDSFMQQIIGPFARVALSPAWIVGAGVGIGIHAYNSDDDVELGKFAAGGDLSLQYLFGRPESPHRFYLHVRYQVKGGSAVVVSGFILGAGIVW
ncbi:MAG: hypothetical protein IT285_08895 [Bdellovibrionales bacterium]|nr:hypothetical protein [Bdellovibrionales bacterium]